MDATVLVAKAQYACAPEKGGVSVVFVPKDTSPEAGILLLNCKSCDDMLRLDEDHPRPCLCGASTARFVQKKWLLGGPARLMRISFEEYDGAIKGAPRRWELV